MIVLIENDYYWHVDNSDCNAPDEYILEELGPNISWFEYSNMSDEIPF